MYFCAPVTCRPVSVISWYEISIRGPRAGRHLQASQPRQTDFETGTEPDTLEGNPHMLAAGLGGFGGEGSPGPAWQGEFSELAFIARAPLGRKIWSINLLHAGCMPRKENNFWSI